MLHTLRHPTWFLDHPRGQRILATLGLLLFALGAGYASAQQSFRYPAAVILICMMVLFRRWQEPYVLGIAVFLLLTASSELPGLAEKGHTYRWHALLLLLGIGGLRMIYERDWRFRYHPLMVAVACWMGYLLWSSLWAWDLQYSFPRALAITATILAAFFVVWRYVGGGVPAVGSILEISTGLFLFFLLLQHLPGLGDWTIDGRFQGVMYHVNALGTILVLTIPLGIFVALDAPVRPAFRIMGLLLFLLSTGQLLFCASRAAILGAIAAVLIYFTIRNPWKVVLTLLILGLLVFICIGYGVDLVDTLHLETLVRPKTLPSGANRTVAWQIALAQHQLSPIWGYGYFSGRFLVTQTEYGRIAQQHGFGHYHNSYLEILIDLGWIGAAPFLLFLLLMASQTLRAMFRHRRERSYLLLVLGLASVIVAGFIHAVFESWLLQPGSLTTLFFWCLVAILWRAILEPERFLSETEPHAAPS